MAWRLPKRGVKFDLCVMGALAVVSLSALVQFGQADRGGFIDEAIPFRQALTLWGWGESPPTANPHFFSYTSLSIYLHWLAQAIAVQVGQWMGRYQMQADAGVEYVLDPTYLVMAGRALTSLAVDVCALLLYVSWRHRSRVAGAVLAASVCISPLFIRSILRMPPEILMTPLVVALIRIASDEDVPTGRRIALVGLVSGALLGMKLSAIPCCLLALAWATNPRAPIVQRLAQLCVGALVAATICVCTTPYAVLDHAAFLRDTAFEWNHLVSGHIAGSVAGTAAAHAGQLFEAVGFPLTAALGAAMFSFRSFSSRAWLALSCALTFVLPAMLSRSGGPDRYMLPSLPLLSWFIAEAWFATCRHGGRLARLLSVVLMITGAVQLGWMLTRTAAARLPTPAARAGEWVRQSARPSEVILLERGAMAIPSSSDARSLSQSRCFRSASSLWQERARTARYFSAVTLPFAASGEISTRVELPGEPAVWVRAFSPAWRMVPAVYEPLPGLGPHVLVRTASLTDRLSKLSDKMPIHSDPIVPAGRRIRFQDSPVSVRRDAEVVVELTTAPAAPAPQLEPAWWTNAADFIIDPPQGAGRLPRDTSEVLRVAPTGIPGALRALSHGHRGGFPGSP